MSARVNWNGGGLAGAVPHRRPFGGFTLLEMIIVLAVLSVIMLITGSMMASQVDAVDVNMQSLVAETQCDRAMLALFEDLQTTNTTDTDQAKQPYCLLKDTARGPNTEIVFRCVEGFDVDADADTVLSRYGPQVSYTRNDDDQLIRTEEGESRVIAHHIAACEFAISDKGAISFRIVAYAGEGESRTEVVHQMSVTPRNGSN